MLLSSNNILLTATASPTVNSPSSNLASTSNRHDPTDLTLDDLLKIQRILQRRARRRDSQNHQAIGFGPRIRDNHQLPGLCARFFVHRKKKRVNNERRIPEQESIRWRSTTTGRWRSLQLATDVCQCITPLPSGVEVRSAQQRATSSLLVAWSTSLVTHLSSESPLDLTDSRWRLGLVSVAHAFPSLRTNRRHSGNQLNFKPQIERFVHCDRQPTHIPGALIVRARLPGNPDCALLETNYESLWLSGFLPQASSLTQFLPAVSLDDINRLIEHGGQGYLNSLRKTVRWRFDAYFPERHVDGIGVQQQVIQVQTSAPENHPAPFLPGTSGAILTDGGSPLAMQFAANRPHFDVALAQLLSHSLTWLQATLNATQLGIVGVF